MEGVRVTEGHGGSGCKREKCDEAIALRGEGIEKLHFLFMSVV